MLLLAELKHNSDQNMFKNPNISEDLETFIVKKFCSKETVKSVGVTLL
jgi:hypothetical protein